MYYKLTIDQVCRTNPGAEPWSRWDKEVSTHKTLEDVADRLKELYGKMPIRKDSRKIYRDKEDGTAEHVGYTYSFWEYLNDRSQPANKKFWATDWITVLEMEARPPAELEKMETHKF